MRYDDPTQLEADLAAAGVRFRGAAVARLALGEGKDVTEIAAALGMTRQAVLVAAGRVKKKLKLYLDRVEAEQSAIIPYPDPENDYEHAAELLEAMRGNAPARPPLETEDQWGRSVGIKTSPIVSISEAARCVRAVRRSRREGRTRQQIGDADRCEVYA